MDMDIVFVLLPASLLLALLGIGAFIWATRSGQFDDCDTPPLRMLNDDRQNDRGGERTLNESGE